MNVRDRFLKTVRGETADRVPLDLPRTHRNTREQIAEIDDPGRREIAERVFPYHIASWGVPTGVNRYLVTPPQRIREVRRERTDGGTVTTTEIDTPKGTLTAVTGKNALTETTWTLKYPCETIEDIKAIMSVPWELPEGIAPPDESQKPADFDERYIARAGVSSPMVCVGGMMRYERFLELCATEFELMKDCTAICLERILDVLDVVLAAKNVDYVWMGGCEWLTPPMGSPRLYEALVQGPEAAVIERIHAGGALSHVHCHGNVRSTLEAAIARGADLFEPVEPPPDGDITLAEAKAVVDGRMTLAGNVEARVLEYGTAEEVEAACRAAFAGCKERFVFSTTAGPYGPMSEVMLRNYRIMMDVYEALSPI